MISVPCPFCGAEHTAGAFVCPTTNRRLQGLLQLDTVVDEKYRIDGIIGVGGMGVVYKAEHSKIRREVALKMLLPEYIVYPDLVARVEREARTAGQIDHPNVVSIVDLGITEAHGPYIAMELLRGQELATTVENAGGRLDPAEAVEVMRQVLSGLEAAHKKGVIHRDLKPENIFLTESTDGVRGVKVLDFGISKLRDDTQLSSLTRTGTVMGTPQFMAPEQAAGSRDQDSRIDVYAAGAVLYAVLCNGLPYEGENYNLLISEILTKAPVQILERFPSMDPRLAAIVMRSIAKKPDQRYQTARAMQDALGHWYEIRNTPRTGAVRLQGLSAGGSPSGSLLPERARGLSPGLQSDLEPALRRIEAIVHYDEDLSPDDPEYIEKGEATVVVPVPFMGEEHTDPSLNGHSEPSSNTAIQSARPSVPDASVQVNGRPSLPPDEPRASTAPHRPDSDPNLLQLSALVKESPLDAPPIVLPPAPKPPPTDEAWEMLRTSGSPSQHPSGLILDDLTPRSPFWRWAAGVVLLVLLCAAGAVAFKHIAPSRWHRGLQRVHLEEAPLLPIAPVVAVIHDSGAPDVVVPRDAGPPPALVNVTDGHHHRHRDR